MSEGSGRQDSNQKQREGQAGGGGGERGTEIKLPVQEKRALTALLGVQVQEEELDRELQAEILELKKKVSWCSFDSGFCQSLNTSWL